MLMLLAYGCMLVLCCKDNDAQGAVTAAAKLPAPVVLLFNAKTKKLVWSMPLPKGGTSEIEGKFK